MHRAVATSLRSSARAAPDSFTVLPSTKTSQALRKKRGRGPVFLCSRLAFRSVLTGRETNGTAYKYHEEKFEREQRIVEFRRLIGDNGRFVDRCVDHLR